MKKRSVAAVIIFSIITSGIYQLYWYVSTKNEMNARGEQIPTAWLLLIPYAGFIIWIFKYSKAVDHVTGGKSSTALSFILLWLLGGIGSGIIQSSFNEVGETATVGASITPQYPVNPVADQPVVAVNNEVPITAQPLVASAPLTDQPDTTISSAPAPIVSADLSPVSPTIDQTQPPTPTV